MMAQLSFNSTYPENSTLQEEEITMIPLKANADQEYGQNAVLCGEYICQSTDIHPGVHAAAFLIFGLFGCSSNCITIYLHSTKDKYSGSRFYILLLTYLDMTALIINLPQFIFIRYIPCCVIKWTSFWPYNFTHVLYLSSSLWLIAIGAREIIRMFYENENILRYATILYPLLCVLVLICTYFMIIIKLLKQSNKMERKIAPINKSSKNENASNKTIALAVRQKGTEKSTRYNCISLFIHCFLFQMLIIISKNRFRKTTKI